MQHNTSLCTIIKNSEDVVDTFFKWAVQNFSEINVVLDPNNDDATRIKCATWEDIYQNINLVEHEFDDFSSQWNRAIDMTTKKYCIYMGSDEILEEIPENGIENFMWRTNSDVGVLSRYNFQGDDEHFIHYPDSQFRIIKMESGIRMNGKLVDETLGIKAHHLMSHLPWHILHYGHIRPVNALRLKGKDRIRFKSDDSCDGEMLEKYGEEWFIERNKLWNDKKFQVPIYITEYSRKYWKC